MLKPFVWHIAKTSIPDSEAEDNLFLFEQAMVRARAELEQLKEKFSGLNPEKYEILSAHAVILEDEEVCEGIKRAIIEAHKCAPWAIFRHI